MLSDGSFQQSRMVDDLHTLPRFGHSNRISKLASFDRTEQEDYFRGILGFCLFLAIVFYVWVLAMIIFKFAFPNYAGCAAGGKMVDVGALRKARIPREVRRRHILRSWRVQWAFLIASVGIPITTLLMTRNGLTPLINSLDEIESINDEVEAVAFRGIAIAESLQHEREKLHKNFTRQDLGLAEACPTFSQIQHNRSVIALPIDIVAQYVQVGLDEVDEFIGQHAPDAQVGLDNVVGVTQRVDTSIEWSYANDWALKFFLLTINVVNGFFLFGVFLSKQDIISYRYQRFLSYGLIPIFGLLLVCSMVLACGFGMASMLNADFCHGNRSSNGTIAEIMDQRGTGESDISYRAFVHYLEGCLDESPLDFVHDLDPLIRYTKNAVNLLEKSFDTYTPEELTRHCVDDVRGLASRLPQLGAILNEIQYQIRAVVELTGCHQISPILRRILHGTTCSETVDALTWLFGGMCTITILGFVMLTVRAGLFNSVVRAPRRKRKREREKEFDEYKEYMAEFYEDADHWEIEASEKMKAALFAEDIHQQPTFETDATSKSADDDDDNDCADDGSDAACFASPAKKSQCSDDEEASEYSYESDYSSDSEEEQRSIMSTSVIGRFFHSRQNTFDDSQSASMLGMSMLDGDANSQSHVRPQVGSILDLQTPRRRRKHPLPAPYAFADRSPESVLSPRHSAGASPEASGCKGTPLAPAKQRRVVHGTKGVTKES